MKQGQVVVFLVKPEEISALAQGYPLTIRPDNGMTPFLLMADPPVVPPMNGRPPAAIEETKPKDYTVHRRPPGPGKGRYECKCGTTAKTLSRLFKHQKRAHAQS